MEAIVSFEQGRMDSDSNPSILQKGVHIESENIDFFSGAAVPMRGISSLTDLKLINAVSLGKLKVPAENKIYNLYKSDNSEGLYEYNIDTGEFKHILRSTTNQLNLSTKIPKMNLIGDFIFWSGDNNPPRRVDRTITYVTNGFEEKDISVIKPAPLMAPELVLSNTLNGETNLEAKFISFATRFKYISGEYSAFSPFSKIAFLPKGFDYDYSTHTNNGMINKYNTVDIKYNTGDRLVEEVELLFKETGSNAVYIIDSFNKNELGFSDNEEQSHTFTNNKRHKVLPVDQLSRMFDNVPLEVHGSQEIIGNRLIYGNYVDGYDFVDSEGNKIEFAHSVEVVDGDAATIIAPKESVKSNRDYEVAIVYSDPEGRMATPIVSKTNTKFIDFDRSRNTNKLEITIPHKAPAFAKSYRFFIKQSRIDYEVMIPSLFYEDGVFVWIRYEEADKDKIAAGEYLVVKRDTSGDLSRNIEVKILEEGYKEDNFLRPELTGDEATDAELRKITNKSGYYFKIKPEKFSMNTDDLETLEDTSYHNTRAAYDDYFQNEVKSIGQAIPYGVNLSGVSSSGAYLPPATSSILDYSNQENKLDIRFKATIDTSGTSFSWSCTADTTTPPSGSAIDIPLTGGTFALAYGVEIVFPDRTGTDTYPYTPDEYVTISAKNKFDDSESFDRAVSCLKGFEGNEIIEGGASVQFWVKEYGGSCKCTLYEGVYTKFSSSQYKNIEEWWHEDGIDISDIPNERVFFRRGYKNSQDDSYKFYEDNSIVDGEYTHPMHIFFRGQVDGKSTSDTRGKISSSITIIQSISGSSFPIFETRPIEEVDVDKFYEIGDTYLIDSNGYHLGNTEFNSSDINQSLGVDAKIVSRFFNCYTFGNSIESYKIRDEFNEKKLSLDARVLVPIEDYKRTENTTDFTYSGAFSESTKVNKLNEFNLSNLNFKELSSNQDGPIRLLASRRGDILVFQHNLVSKVLFGKTVLASINGNDSVSTTDDVLGAQTFYSHTFGIGDNAESYAEHGNNFFFVDPNSGTFVRGGYSGLDEIVNGQKNHFKDSIRYHYDNIQGVYDLNKDAYIASVNHVLNYYKEEVSGWSTRVSRSVDMMISLNNRTFAFINGDVYEFYTGANLGGTIKTVINDNPNETKTFESLKLNSAFPVDVTVTSDGRSSIVDSYELRENFYHGDIPKSTISESNKYGLGVVSNVSDLNITIESPINPKITVGDSFEVETGVVGVIESHSGDTLILSEMKIQVNVGDFVLGSKNSSIEGDTIRGSVAILDIDLDSGKEHKLLTISADIDKSYN